MSTLSSPSSSSRQTADRLVLACLGGSLALALGLGAYYGGWGMALGVGGLLALVGGGIYLMAPGTLASRMALSLSLMASVALHIQLARGTLEFHFGVFVTLALLLFYRDWRPLLGAAGLIAVHHLLFDRLQAAGAGVYCMTEAGLPRVLVHAGYVVVQTAAELFIVRSMAAAARESEELEALVRHLGHGDRVRLDVHRLQATLPLSSALKQALVNLHNVVVTVRGSVGSLSVSASEIASGNNDLSTRTERAASSLQQTASSMQRLAVTVHHSADAASNANQLVRTAADGATQGGDLMTQVIASMDRISTSSRRIADIIGTIDGIAFQTNILALNAAVEAARAGEQGRGFAVVASEVRSLAQRSAGAAREIKSLIEESVGNVSSGSTLVQSAGGAMTHIVDGVRRVSDIISEITSGSQEQSHSIEELHQAVTHLDQMTQQNAALVEQSAAAAESMEQQARRLAEAVAGFQLDERAAAHA